jgi:Flp pilus assembly protein TadD
MRRRLARALTISLAGLWLAGCSTSQDFSKLFSAKSTSGFGATDESGQDAFASASPFGASADSEEGLLGSDRYDELSRGKRQYRLGNYGLAEKHFRKAVESHPRDAEAWLGLAASYDRLRRFDLADRAYAQAIRIVGPTVEILNNQGYSYMLRGDYKRARATLLKAKRKEPKNKYVANNLRLLNRSAKLGKAIE